MRTLESFVRRIWRLKLGMAALLTVLAAPTAFGQSPGGPGIRGRVTLREAIAAALARNPDVVLAELRVDSAQGERAIAAGIPNPSFTVIPGVPTQYAAQASIDVGPTRHYRMRASREGRSATVLDFRDTQRQIVFNVRQAFYDLLLTDSLRGLAREQVDIFRQLLAADSARLRSGSIAEREVVSTRLRLAHAEAGAFRADASVRAARLTLQQLMGIAQPDTGLQVAGSLTFRVVPVVAESLLTRAFANRPDLAAASMRIDQSESLHSLARANLVPVPSAGVSYQPAAPFPTGSHYAPTVGFNVPVFYLFRGERERAAAGLRSARTSAERTRTQIRVDVTVALDSYASSRMLAERYAGSLLAEAAGALDAARYGYLKGATSLLDLLEAIGSYGDTRTDYLTTVHDYWVSVFALSRATGVDLAPDEP